MQEQILSRTRLEPIIEKLGLYPLDRGRVHIEDLVERLRTSITITPLTSMPGTKNQSLPGFYVNVTFRVNPQTWAADLHGNYIDVYGTECARP